MRENRRGGGKDGRQMVVVVPICKFCEEPCSSLAPLAPWRGRCRGGPLRLLVPGPPPAPPLPGPDLTPVKPERREGLNCKKKAAQTTAGSSSIVVSASDEAFGVPGSHLQQHCDQQQLQVASLSAAGTSTFPLEGAAVLPPLLGHSTDTSQQKGKCPSSCCGVWPVPEGAG